MSLIRFSPFNALDEIREELARSIREQEGLCCQPEYMFLPVEFSEDEKNYYLRASVPGIKPEDISIEYEDGILSISCLHNARDINESEKVHLSEFYYGTFKRSIKLGKGIDSENICADYNNGILTVTVQKLPEAVKKVIKINNTEHLQ